VRSRVCLLNLNLHIEFLDGLTQLQAQLTLLLYRIFLSKCNLFFLLHYGFHELLLLLVKFTSCQLNRLLLLSYLFLYRSSTYTTCCSDFSLQLQRLNTYDLSAVGRPSLCAGDRVVAGRSIALLTTLHYKSSRLCFLRTGTINPSRLFLGCTTTTCHSDHSIGDCISRISRLADSIPYLGEESGFT
jgi:hypothetical protein